MKITCQACGAKYTIADDKVRGRKVKIRCKGCSAPIVVDAQQGEPEGADSGSHEGAEALDTMGSVPPPADGWSVNLSDSDQRTMTTEEIVAGFKAGAVTSDAFVWKEGLGDWVAVLDHPELAALIGASSAPVHASPAPAAAAVTPFAGPVDVSPSPKPAEARRAGGRAPAVDLFGGVDLAGSEEEVATSAPPVQHAALPQAGSTAYGDDKLTGARNENSVLFSLDALKTVNEPKKAPAPGKKGAPPPRPGQAARKESDPFGLGSSNDLMNIGGGGNPLFSMNANQALLTAPAAPEPPPQRSTDLGLTGPASFSMPEKKKSKGMLIGIGAGVLALIGVGVFALGGGKEEAKTEIPSASAEAPAAAAEAPKVEEKKEEPKPAETTPPPAASAPASAAPAESAAPAAADTSQATSTAPATGKATTAATPAKKEEKEEAPVSNAGPFSISAAQAALGSAAAGAGSCKKPGGPTGAGKVQVTFAPSGRVTTANVAAPPFAGTPVGGCVASVFRRAKVPPFSGNPVTVSKSFVIN